MGHVIRQNDENQNSLISGGNDETGFEYVESEVSADDPGIGVQWEVRKIVWNSEDGFGQNSKHSGLLDLFLTPDICLCISHDFPFSRESSQPRDRTQVSCTAGQFFTS